jgi:hypothetical protein
MEESNFVALFLIVFGALPCFISGFFMAIKQKRGLIASWNDNWFSDPVKAANILGYSMFVCSFILLLSSISLWLKLIIAAQLQYFFILLALVLMGSFAYIKLKYGKGSS